MTSRHEFALAYATADKSLYRIPPKHSPHPARRRAREDVPVNFRTDEQDEITRRGLAAARAALAAVAPAASPPARTTTPREPTQPRKAQP